MTPNPTPNQLLVRLIKGLISAPEKLNAAESSEGSALVVVTWAQDHARIVGKGGETIYALRKIAEYMGVRLTLSDPLHDINAAVQPAEQIDVGATIKALHAAAGDHPEIEAEDVGGMHCVAVKGAELTPDFQRAVALVFRKIGTIRRSPIEVVYE